jgi:hypothetical protein
MVRTPEESKGFPLSIHHPSCNDFKQIAFVKVMDGDGSSFIDTRENAEALVAEEKDYSIGIEIMLTQDQFDSLPEYQP